MPSSFIFFATWYFFSPWQKKSFSRTFWITALIWIQQKMPSSWWLVCNGASKQEHLDTLYKSIPCHMQAVMPKIDTKNAGFFYIYFCTILVNRLTYLQLSIYLCPRYYSHFVSVSLSVTRFHSSPFWASFLPLPLQGGGGSHCSYPIPPIGELSAPAQPHPTCR